MTTITGSPPAAITGTYVNPVAASTKLSGLSQAATSLGLESGIVANLGGSTSGTPLYNAVGLLNSIISAGTASGYDSSASSTTSTPPASASGNYSAAGTVQGTSSNVNANWATVLKAEPAAATTVAADSTIQGILSSISTTA